MPDVGAALEPFTDDDGWFLGEDKTLEWQLDDGTVGSAPSGTGSWTLVWQLRQRANDPGDPIIEKTPTFADPARIQVEIAREDTEELAPGTYHYTLARTNAGDWQALAYGDVELLQPDVH